MGSDNRNGGDGQEAKQPSAHTFALYSHLSDAPDDTAGGGTPLADHFEVEAPGGTLRAEALLRRGEASVTYRVIALNEGLDRALTVYKTPLPRDRAALEAAVEALGALRHPNIVRALGIATVKGAPGLITELAPGPTVAEFLAGRKLEVSEAERVFRGALAGVAAAHARGILHLRLHPGSVVLASGQGGRRAPKIVGLGLAPAWPELPLAAGWSAPELTADPAAADQRADIFSLGCLLYTLLTRDAPFQNDAYTSYTSLNLIRPDLPAGLRAVVDACLAVDPDARPGDCQALLTLMDEAAAPPPPAHHMSVESLAPGTAISGRYVVAEKLGQGGMAAVYRVRHAKLQTDFALKLVSVSSFRLRDRLIQEGRLQAALTHPNVVRVTDVVDFHGTPGLVMEFIRGPSLYDLLDRRRLTLEQADTLARGILAGVGSAHGHGMVHRDLKPANILIAPAPTGPVAKVADFGLAKALESGSMGQTRTGETMGTPAYMAPEQINDAKDVDARADIFALGAILYEMVTGTAAFQGDTLLKIFNAVDEGRYIPPRELSADLPDRMAMAIEGALVTDRSRRIPDCQTLAAVWEGRVVFEGESVAAAAGGEWAEVLGSRGGALAPKAGAPLGSETFSLGDMAPAETAPPVAAVPRRWPLAAGGIGALALAVGLWGATGGGERDAPVEQPVEAPGPAPDVAEEPPTEASPKEEPQAEEPQAEAPPTEAPPVEQAPPAEAPPAEAPPAEAPPAEAPPAEAPPTEPPPTEPPADPDPPDGTADADDKPDETTAQATPAGPPPGMARLLVSGDAELVSFQSAAGLVKAGDIAPGAYQILFLINGAYSDPVGQISLAAGEVRSIHCVAAALRCKY